MQRGFIVLLVVFVIIILIVCVGVRAIYSSGTDGFVKHEFDIPLELIKETDAVSLLNGVNDLVNQKELLNYQFEHEVEPFLFHANKKVSGIKRLKLILLGSSIAEKNQEIKDKLEIFRSKLPGVRSKLDRMEEDVFYKTWLKLEDRIAQVDSI
ncbi:MAG: hypothetical protein AB7S48_16390 [Bacteroidales bacterium]